MIIGINALFLLPCMVGGSETYIRNLVKCFAKTQGDNSFVVFINKESVGIFDALSPMIEVVCSPIHASNRPLRILWEQLVLPFQVWRYKIDILFSAGMTSPFFCPVSSVLVLFDLQHVNQPQNYPAVHLCFLRTIIYLSAKTADGIVTISEKVRKDIIKDYRIAPDEIAVTYLAVDHNAFFPRGRNETEAIRAKYELPERFVLYAASSLPHKNHTRLFEALKIVKTELGNIKLVLIGARDKGDDLILAKIKELDLEDDIVFTGWLPYEDMPLIYCASEVFVFPSLYEGFGIPVLEAMACGIPVVCSNIEPITKVVGNAAILVDPYSPVDIARGIISVSVDKKVCNDLVRKGFKRAAEFTWKDTAEKSLIFMNSLKQRK